MKLKSNTRRCILNRSSSLGYSSASLLLGVGALVACGAGPEDNQNYQAGVIDANNDGIADDLVGTPLDTNNDGVYDGIDKNGDGVADGALLDTNNDGIFDAIDTNYDGQPDINSDLGSGGATGNSGSGGGAVSSGVGGDSFQGGGGMGGPGSGGGGVVGAGGGQATGGNGSGEAGPGGFIESGTMAACTFTVNGSHAEQMPTVGVVDFSVMGLAGAVTGAMIEFGLDTNYGMHAPVDLGASGYKTLLLGMRKDSTYHLRVAVSTGTEFCYSPDVMIETGKFRSGINEINKQVTGTVAPGFFVAAADNTALIFDQDGEVVWGYTFQTGGGMGLSGIFSAKMSYDGKYMLARDLGPFNDGRGGRFFRVAMDGSDYSDFDVPGGDHHDFTITPTGIAYIAKEAAGGYDKIYTANDDGTNAQELVDLKPIIQAYPQGEGLGGMGELSHFNAIHYWEDRDVYTVSNRESDVIAVVSGSGQIMSGVGKSANASFMTVLAEGAEGGGGNKVWRVQHGHDMYAEDKLLVFSNGDFGAGRSRALHYTLNGNTATLDWEYSAMGESMTQGDIQMLPNGNVAITASNAGTIHQIDSNQQLQASYTNGANGFGYVSFRESLYGAPAPGR